MTTPESNQQLRVTKISRFMAGKFRLRLMTRDSSAVLRPTFVTWHRLSARLYGSVDSWSRERFLVVGLGGRAWLGGIHCESEPGRYLRFEPLSFFECLLSLTQWSDVDINFGFLSACSAARKYYSSGSLGPL